MKRCGECGWPNNADSNTDCEKCGAALDENAANSANVPHTPPSNSPQPPADGKKTVIGGGHNMPAWDANTPSTPPPKPVGGDTQILKCQSCGFYPLRAALSPSAPCPNCGTTGAGQGTPPQSASHSNELKKTQMFGNISFEENKPKKFKLVENNQHEKLFEGEQVQIGRNNIDPENFSISGQHATIEMIDGQWHISNQSSNGFTFVQAKGKVALNDGDIIVIGNKIFQFRSE